MDSNSLPNPQEDPKAYWQNVKDFALAAFSAAIGDPEAMKTIVDVLANASYKGMEHLDLEDQQKLEIKKKLEDGMNTGADGIISALSKFQKASLESNVRLRAKYGRKPQNGVN